MDTRGSRTAVAAAIAAAAWAASGVAALAFAGEDPGPVGSVSYYLIEGTHAAAETAMLWVLAAVWAPLTGRSGRLAGAGYRTAFGGTALLAVLTWLSVILPAVGVRVTAASEGVSSVLFLLALLGTLVGFVALGVVVARSSVWPTTLGMLLIAHPFLIVVLLSAYVAGGLALGVLWLAVGWLAVRHVREPAARPA